MTPMANGYVLNAKMKKTALKKPGKGFLMTGSTEKSTKKTRRGTKKTPAKKTTRKKTRVHKMPTIANADYDDLTDAEWNEQELNPAAPIPGPVSARIGRVRRSPKPTFSANNAFPEEFVDFLETAKLTRVECLFLGTMVEKISYCLPPHELEEVARILSPLFDTPDKGRP